MTLEYQSILLTSLLALASAVIGGFISYHFTSKSKKLEAIIKFREEKYSNLLILLQGFVGSTTSSEIKKKFFEEQYKSWIYGSDEVVLAINNLVELVLRSQGTEPNPEEGRKAIGNIVLAMRKDLLGKTNLSYKDFRYTDVAK
ncbi:MAG: hypothetical protein EOO93_26430 [Pedobacter sp.]|nr:MAG: hypothetical protein EOO93_26430 [Pedobacter sp.]